MSLPPRVLTPSVSAALALIVAPLPLWGQAVLSEFAGSTPLGTYESAA